MIPDDVAARELRAIAQDLADFRESGDLHPRYDGKLAEAEINLRGVAGTVEARADMDDEDDDGIDPSLVTDGGQPGEWTVHDPETGNRRALDSRAEAEDVVAEMGEMGIDVDLYPPGERPPDDDEADGADAPTDATATATAAGGATSVAATPAPDGGPADPAPTAAEAMDLSPRSVAEDPLEWVPGDFVDEIDGTPAINRKGFEVLSHFYDIAVHVDLDVPPEETDFEYCRVKATATTPDGRECEAFGSAHVDRDDDPEILLEMADTRARKRALSVATGVGAVAVEELRNEVGGQEGDD